MLGCPIQRNGSVRKCLIQRNRASCGGFEELAGARFSAKRPEKAWLPRDSGGQLSASRAKPLASKDLRLRAALNRTPLNGDWRAAPNRTPFEGRLARRVESDTSGKQGATTRKPMRGESGGSLMRCIGHLFISHFLCWISSRRKSVPIGKELYSYYRY